MFRGRILATLFLGSLIGSLNHSGSLAQEIWSPDGTLVFEDGVPKFDNGTELFTFQYHKVPDDSDPTNLMFVRDAEVIPLDPVDIFRRYGNAREILNVEGMAELIEQSRAGGFAAAFSDMVLMELAVMQNNCIVNGAPAEDTDIKPVFSSIRLHTNPIRGNLVLNVFSYKNLFCTTDEAEPDIIPLKRRWVIVVESGLEQRVIDKTIGGVKMTYKMFAQGKSVKLMAYYSNLTLTDDRWQKKMQLISGFDEFGNIDPRNKYYDSNVNSCLDIDFKEKPKNDQVIASIAPSDMRFCARGCIPGDVSATK